jgi:DNA invertase Pin-like site-specific DNA recombinase
LLSTDAKLNLYLFLGKLSIGAKCGGLSARKYKNNCAQALIYIARCIIRRMTRFIAYFRVSTTQQGKSGLGLDAQRQAVADYVGGRGEIIAEYTEIESGRKNGRPQLAAALAICRKHKAVLVIAKLDRLARNVHFISGLMESGVDFVAVDIPEANRLTIHILSAVAEYEREAISKRTKDALKAAKARGVKLGNPDPIPAARLGNAAAKEQREQFHATVKPLIQKLRHEGYSLAKIAAELHARNVPTARGRVWYPATVRNILRRDAYGQSD